MPPLKSMRRGIFFAGRIRLCAAKIKNAPKLLKMILIADFPFI